jgi:hypothetical protein
LRLATVIEVTSDDVLLVTLDGDTVNISAFSMVGPIPVGTRVYVISLPPAGNYVVGFVSTTRTELLRHVTHYQDTASTTASGTFANLTNLAGVAFVAPFSGIVTILYSAQLANSAINGISILAPRVGTGDTVGAGTDVLVADSDNGITFQEHGIASRILRAGAHYTLSGLTPGDDYNVSMQGAIATAGTATFQRIQTTVIPSP